MTCLERLLLDHPEFKGVVEQKIDACCPNDFGYFPTPEDCDSISCRTCWNREIPEEKKTIYEHIGPFDTIGDAIAKIGEGAAKFGVSLDSMTNATEKECPICEGHGIDDLSKIPHILDSGNRTVFESGAVRDIQEGKGRCDLLPLDVVGFYYAHDEDLSNEDSPQTWVFYHLSRFVLDGQIGHLRKALRDSRIFVDPETMFLETAIHYEEGAKKYDENNWKKGIPVKRYIDSGVRHYLKFLRGDTDERHDRAFCWNMMGAIWTCKHIPELNEYRKTELGEACERKEETI